MTVLVVDDDPEVRDVAVEMLRELGAAVLDAKDGQTALALLRSHPQIDLLVSDVRDGAELAERALALRPHLKVVIVSGYAGDLTLFGVRFLSKPLPLNEIAALCEA